MVVVFTGNSAHAAVQQPTSSGSYLKQAETKGMQPLLRARLCPADIFDCRAIDWSTAVLYLTAPQGNNMSLRGKNTIAILVAVLTATAGLF